MIDQIKHLLDQSTEIALSDPKASYSFAYEALQLARQEGLELEKGIAYYSMAYACRVMSDYPNGLQNALLAYDIFTKVNSDEGKLKVRNIIGIVYFYYGDYKTSLENFNEALTYLKHLVNPKLEASILNNIGEIYRVASDYDNAMIHYRKALELSITNAFTTNISIIHANIGEIYYRQGHYDKASHYFDLAFDDSLKTNDIVTRGEAQTKLGYIRLAQGLFDQSRQHFVNALELFNEVNNKFYLVEALIGFSELDEAIGRNPKLHLMEALNNAIENHLALKISEIYKKLVAYHESQNEFEMALYYHKLFYQKEKEIEVSNLSMKLELIALEFDYYREQNHHHDNKILSEKLTREISETQTELQQIKAQNINLMAVSMRDELTQLYNRRGINHELTLRINEMNPSLDAILMIDIDRFKDYNDYWGHVQGDECLKKIANHLKEVVADSYFVGRYGGEEFICYMKVNAVHEAQKIAETIRRSIEDLKMKYTAEDNTGTVTISVGGVVDKMTITEIDQYIDYADRNLYTSKASGRNLSIVSAFE